MTRAKEHSCPWQSSLSDIAADIAADITADIAADIAAETITMGRSFARGVALQYELGLVLLHQYSLVPIVPLNCVRHVASYSVWVYQTSNMRGLFHLTRRGWNRHVDGSTLPEVARLTGRGPFTTVNESPACCRQLGKLQTTS